MRILLLSLVFTVLAHSQETKNKIAPTDFSSPMGIRLNPAGTFGELRANHFHSGLDFKTNQVEGLPVYAAGDGYVSRIKYSSFGYGKAIYINHPNGFTSVYGHLQRGAEEVEGYVKKNQYDKQSFEIEVFPQPHELVVKKGDLIAYSGNTGGSGGPHLHFEYRDTKTEEVLNPLLFGLSREMKDTIAPTLENLFAYPLDPNGFANKSADPVVITFDSRVGNVIQANPVQARGRIGFGVSSFDTYNNNFNKNGLYKLELLVDNKPQYVVNFDALSFSESRYINSYIDYRRRKLFKDYIQKLFYTTKYPLSIISHNVKDGILEVKEGDSYTVEIILSDFHKNQTKVIIPVIFAADDFNLPAKPKNGAFDLIHDKETIYAKENISVTIPENTFLEDFEFNFQVNQNTLMLHRDVEPAYKDMTIAMDVSEMTDLNVFKSYIARVDGKKLSYQYTTKKGNVFSTRTKSLGTYKIATDLVAPKIYSPSFKPDQNLDKVNSIKVYIEDLDSGIASYEGYLNGKWILMDYDYKTKSLIHYFSDNIYEDGENLLKIIVKDNVGNTAIFDSNFQKTKN